MGIKLADGLLLQNSLTLGEAYKKFVGDRPSDIPFAIWLIENPDSPIALPGKISLAAHDCIHLLLNRGLSLEDEAFVIGFTMGNDDNTNRFYQLLFKFISMHFYPNKYRFNKSHLVDFDLGFALGKKTSFRNINLFDFSCYYSKTIAEIRLILNLNKGIIE